MSKHNQRLTGVLAGTLLMIAALAGCQSKKDKDMSGGDTTTASHKTTTSATAGDTRSSNIMDDVSRGASDAINGISTGVSDAMNDIGTGISDAMGGMGTAATR